MFLDWAGNFNEFISHYGLSPVSLVLIGLVFSICALISIREVLFWFTKQNILRRDIRRLSHQLDEVLEHVKMLEKDSSSIQNSNPDNHWQMKEAGMNKSKPQSSTEKSKSQFDFSH